MKKLVVVIGVLLGSLFISTNISLAAPFKDVPEKHFAKDAIQWASDTGFVNGVENGVFKPNDPISFEQFAKLTAIYFDLEQSQHELTPGGGTSWIISNQQYNSWSKAYYDQLAAYQVPYLHYFNDEALRYQPINRGLLAQVLGYLLNGEAELQNSIQYLQQNGITKMKYPKYHTTELQFDIKGSLTRAEAVTFFYRLNDKGIKSLHKTVKENFEKSNVDLNSFKTGTNSATAAVNPLVKTYLAGTLPKFYSEEIILLEKQLFEKELTEYNVVLNIKPAMGEFSMVAAEKMLTKFTKPITAEITKRGYEVISSIEYYSDLFGQIYSLYFEHPEHGTISLSLESDVLSLSLGKPYMIVSNDQLTFFLKIASAVMNFNITTNKLAAIEKDYAANYSMSKTMFYFDDKKSISFSLDEYSKYHIGKRLK